MVNKTAKKNLVFMHQNYPAQFGPITRFLLENYDVRVSFLSQYFSREPIPGLEAYPYTPATTGHEESPYFFSRYFEQECASMHGLLAEIQRKKIEPDVLIGHVAFGNMGLLHVPFPDVPKIGFFELFYDPYHRHSDNRPEYPSPLPNRIRVPLRNATQLIELQYCTRGYSPTPFQRSTYPEEYQYKLECIFDGINVNQYSPGEVGSGSELKRTWPSDAKIVTYVSRGLEAMRGFDIFIQIANKVCAKRKDVHFVVAGNPKTHYGSEMIHIKEPTFKEFVLKKFPIDESRFTFLDWIPESALVDLFRISDCHFYWTVPFTLSWSLFQAMSTGVIALTSNTAPVRDIIFDGQTGVMTEPNDIDGTVEKMLEILDNPGKYRPMRENARELMVNNYSFEQCLPKLADFYLREHPDVPRRAGAMAATPAV